jgi:phosphoenolpyruvate-protein kinase (PTS system EI component)
MGSRVGNVIRARRLAELPSEPQNGVVWLVPRVSALAGMRLPGSVRAIVTQEIVSMYSHEAVAVWRLEVPVLAGLDKAPWSDGARVLVDFDSGTVVEAAPGDRDRMETSRASRRLDVLSEVEDWSDLRRVDVADGIGIVNVEDLMRMGKNEARQLCEELADVDKVPLAIRFFDRHPDPSVAATMGYRGARVARDQIVVDRFVSWVEDLRLRQEPIVVLPMYAHAEEVDHFARQVAQFTSSIGVTVECPEAALCLEQIVGRCAVVEVGLNDLSQYTLAWSRDIVDSRVMSTEKLSDGVSLLVQRVSRIVAKQPVRYSLGLDLCPSVALVEKIASLGVPSISCPSVLTGWWKTLMPA